MAGSALRLGTGPHLAELQRGIALEYLFKMYGVPHQYDLASRVTACDTQPEKLPITDGWPVLLARWDHAVRAHEGGR
jgi:hypothetical protein